MLEMAERGIRFVSGVQTDVAEVLFAESILSLDFQDDIDLAVFGLELADGPLGQRGGDRLGHHAAAHSRTLRFLAVHLDHELGVSALQVAGDILHILNGAELFDHHRAPVPSAGCSPYRSALP